PTKSSTRIAFAVVFSSVWFPATVVTPSSSTSGLATASSRAIASSCPGSQSRTIRSGKELLHLRGGRNRGLRTGPRRGDRAGGACPTECLAPIAPLQVGNDEAGGEGGAGPPAGA